MSEHLQPESLNAFVEGVLPGHEREQCLAHLAECSHCREIAFLAQQTLAEDIPLDVPTRSVPARSVPAWRRWFAPITGLSAAAALAALLVSIAIDRKPAHAPAAVPATPPQLTAVLKPPAQMEPAPTPKRQPAARAHIKSEPLVAAKDAVTAAPEPAPELPPTPATASPAVAMFADQADKLPSGIAGTVVDPTGAGIPRAVVTLNPIAGTLSSNTRTDTSGQFHVSGLAPGQYTLQVTAPGFSQASKQVQVQPNEIAKADSVLSVGSMSESIEVTAAAAVVNTVGAAELRRSKPKAAKLTSAPAAAKQLGLPSNLPSIATARNDKIMLAVDSAGTLFLSGNSGKTWKTVKTPWQGKVIHLTTANAVFELTTDPASVWLSRDGSHWYPAPAPRDK